MQLHIGAEGPAYRVKTRDRGTLEFTPGDGMPETAADVYGNHWSWQGDLATVDAHVKPSGELAYGRYPNALERIVCGFADTAGQLWATAHRGYEFQLQTTSLHRRGSHGSLDEDDSTSPLMVAGHRPGLVPSAARTVDVCWLCYQLLGIDVEEPPRGRAGRGKHAAPR